MKKIIFVLLIGVCINAQAMVIHNGGTIINGTNDQ